MEHDKNDEANPWKLATFALGGILAVVLIAGLVIAGRRPAVMEDLSPASAPAYDAPPVPADGVPAPRRALDKPPPVPRARAPRPGN